MDSVPPSFPPIYRHSKISVDPPPPEEQRGAVPHQPVDREGPRKGQPAERGSARVDESPPPPPGPSAWRGLPMDRRELERRHAPKGVGIERGGAVGSPQGENKKAPPGFSFGGRYRGEGAPATREDAGAGRSTPPGGEHPFGAERVKVR